MNRQNRVKKKEENLLFVIDRRNTRDGTLDKQVKKGKAKKGGVIRVKIEE
jgi:hypothetical protein